MCLVQRAIRGGYCRAGIGLQCHRQHMRSVLAYGWALGGLGVGPEGGHMVLCNDAGLRGEMGSMLEMSGLGGAHACLVGVSSGSWCCESLGCHSWFPDGLFVRGRCYRSRTDVPDGLFGDWLSIG